MIKNNATIKDRTRDQENVEYYLITVRCQGGTV